MTKVLILQSKQHTQISDTALRVALDILKSNNIEIEVISIEHFYGLPCAASMSLELYEYDGLVILGCLILSEYKLKYKILYREMVRCFADIAVHYAIPVGFGFSIFQDISDAEDKISMISTEAASNCVDLIKLKTRLGYPSYEQFTRYSN